MHNWTDLENALTTAEEKAREQGDESLYYFNYHKERYIFDAFLIKNIIESTNLSSLESIKAIDIGPAFQTDIFRKVFPEFEMDVLVKENSSGKEADNISNTKILEFDLNDSFYPGKWIQVDKKYDIITMLEVIEHLYTRPEQVLEFVSSLLTSNGFLIVQTPNGVSLPYRIRMLLGRNPFMMINETRDSHYREYTRKELIEIGLRSGLKVHSVHMNNVMSTGSLSSRIFNKFSSLMPQDLRKNITIIFQK